ncbi:hypothetical protein NCU05712 [Neurospora crassa OR74A]|uniref:Gasdermin-like protein rcd-1-1 n=2 Tax=Neurospora crassa TaxID=5141 RepID=RCD11_NEUCR|nr:hypothetical protein NCU05712 [Neurospora crassa OR74A]Q7SBA0.1 RecName: Full=Gasdermin-like protein rcd-1-1; AltName: Full=Regulator of cell death 1-1 [Neurospora crassa OR74A]EAA33662.1 hypothetical protein NCU05712 [Neurospora crassa OR74A]|eukprot:XP_962898.1 hypothetical protein NCU05712 [Neurospora crassa OR74A]
MDKCWFTLDNAHYPPPSLDSMRSGHPISPASLGHLIPSLAHLDQIINAKAIEPFPATMDIHGPTIIEDFKWDHSHEYSLSLGGKVPIPLAPAGVPFVDLNVGLGGAFSRSVANYWEFDRLERYIMQPTRSYVQKCIERDEVKRWIAKNKSMMMMGRWEVYMITGIIVARGGGRKKKEKTTGKEFSVEVTVEVPLIVEAGPGGKRNTARQKTWGTSQTGDFVWAVRLAKITKSGLHSDWKMETVFGKTSSFRGQKAIF